MQYYLLIHLKNLAYFPVGYHYMISDCGLLWMKNWMDHSVFSAPSLVSNLASFACNFPNFHAEIIPCVEQRKSKFHHKCENRFCVLINYKRNVKWKIFNSFIISNKFTNSLKKINPLHWYNFSIEMEVQLFFYDISFYLFA